MLTMIKKRKAQSVTEYALLIIIVLGAFVATSFYIKRGIQGRWKQAVDDLGEQYDPTVMTTNVKHSLSVNSQIMIVTQNGVNGYWTNRYDNAITVEKKEGAMMVGF